MTGKRTKYEVEVFNVGVGSGTIIGMLSFSVSQALVEAGMNQYLGFFLGMVLLFGSWGLFSSMWKRKKIKLSCEKE